MAADRQWLVDVDMISGDGEIDGGSVGQCQGGVVDPGTHRDSSTIADDDRRSPPLPPAGDGIHFEHLDNASQRLPVGLVVGALIVPVVGLGAERFRPAPQ